MLLLGKRVFLKKVKKKINRNVKELYLEVKKNDKYSFLSL